MLNLNWSRKELTKQRIGTFGEYYAKMALASYGMSIYTSEVDDHGIDFVAETKSGFMKFQVKTVRQGTSCVYMLEDHFNVEDKSLFLFLSILADNELPVSYIVPATAWNDDTSGMFVHCVYEGKKSKPEYRINLSAKNMVFLENYKGASNIECIKL